MSREKVIRFARRTVVLALVVTAGYFVVDHLHYNTYFASAPDRCTVVREHADLSRWTFGAFERRRENTKPGLREFVEPGLGDEALRAEVPLGNPQFGHYSSLEFRLQVTDQPAPPPRS
ncbi:MAG TPA: hypothetical protein VF821_34360 [Lentzea sp.]